MKIKTVNKSKHKLPEYTTEKPAGMDLRANIDNDITLIPMEQALVGTGIFIELPDGYEAQIRPRSGLAIKKGITILNTPGTIDAEYREEICVILINLSKERFVIKDGERICQMIIAKHEKISWEEVKTLVETKRGTGGFGHSGKE